MIWRTSSNPADYRPGVHVRIEGVAGYKDGLLDWDDRLIIRYGAGRSLFGYFDTDYCIRRYGPGLKIGVMYCPKEDV